MKNLFVLILFNFVHLTTHAQESMEKVMEKRAREMYRVICLSDKEQWKKFIKENYSQALIDKPMRASVESNENGATKSSTDSGKGTDNIEAKASMFARLHSDFGTSKIVSIKPTDENMEMVLENSNGMRGVFTLKFDKNKPHLIEGLGIEVHS